jgi:isopenicillin N synthase-like dioxygenase
MSDETGTAEIPLLEFNRFDAGAKERQAFLADLRRAARDVGFFYLVGHGMDPRLSRELLDSAGRFFALSDADKLALEMLNSAHFRGYTRIAGEITRGRPDWREQIDIGAERDALERTPHAPAWTRLQGPNQWPAKLPELRPVVLQWQTAACQVLERLLRAFAVALGQPAEVFEPLYRPDPHYLLKLIRYPGRESNQDSQGVGPHKDAELLSLLLQDHAAGLEVQTSRGWIGVEPRPGTLVVNIGEALELASDGYLRATLHRVVSPPAGRERLSAAFFLGPRLDARVSKLLLPPDLAAQAPGPERDPHNPLFHDVGSNYLKGRLRSHPDVARRHYADILDAATASPLPSIGGHPQAANQALNQAGTPRAGGCD